MGRYLLMVLLGCPLSSTYKVLLYILSSSAVVEDLDFSQLPWHGGLERSVDGLYICLHHGCFSSPWLAALGQLVE